MNERLKDVLDLHSGERRALRLLLPFLFLAACWVAWGNGWHPHRRSTCVHTNGSWPCWIRCRRRAWWNARTGAGAWCRTACSCSTPITCRSRIGWHGPLAEAGRGDPPL